MRLGTVPGAAYLLDSSISAVLGRLKELGCRCGGGGSGPQVLDEVMRSKPEKQVESGLEIAQGWGVGTGMPLTGRRKVRP